MQNSQHTTLPNDPQMEQNIQSLNQERGNKLRVRKILREEV